MLHPSLRYLILTRWRSRLRGWLGKLRSWKGVLAALFIALSLTGMLIGGGLGGHLAMTQRKASMVILLGFMMIMQILTGLGQRGLVFSRADLDFLFPAPLPRRQLLIYQFVTHYLAAVFMGVMFTLFFGGHKVASPGLLIVGITLCQITNAHLFAAAAEVSMMLADRVHKWLRGFTVPVLVVIGVAGMLLVVGGLSGVGNVPARLEAALDSPGMRILFYPAFQAVALGSAPDLGARLAALAGLLACVVGSFAFVLALRVDFVEASFTTSRKVWRARQGLRRGLHPTSVKRSASGPRSRLFHGAGAVLWLNGLTLRRQLRATVGGLMVILVMFAVLGSRSASSGGGAMLLVMLGMIPLWMALPIGFRIPREQLTILRLLPLKPRRLAAALITVPVLVPLLLQAAAAVTLAALGRLPAALVPPALLAYLVVNTTILAVEGVFALQRPQPNVVNMLQAVTQVLFQMLALMPGLMAAAITGAILQLPIPAILGGAVVQGAVAFAAVSFLGRRIHHESPEITATLG